MSCLRVKVRTMVALSPRLAVAEQDLIEDEEDDGDELFGVLSVVADGVIAYLAKSTTITVDGQDEQFAQICSLDFFYPLILVIPLELFDETCERYGLEYQHLDDLYDDHFCFDQTDGLDASAWDRLQVARGVHQMAMATDHRNDSEEDRADFASVCAMALNFDLIEGTVEHHFKHMDHWVGTFTHLGMFNPSTAEEIEEFFNPAEED